MQDQGYTSEQITNSLIDVLGHEANHALDNSDLQSAISSLNTDLATSISGWNSATNGPWDQACYVSAYQSLQLQNEPTFTTPRHPTSSRADVTSPVR
jgi:hypothetical protein